MGNGRVVRVKSRNLWLEWDTAVRFTPLRFVTLWGNGRVLCVKSRNLRQKWGTAVFFVSIHAICG